MTLTKRRIWAVECDQCGATESVGGVSKRKALRLFAAISGWDLGRGNYADLCPPCAWESV